MKNQQNTIESKLTKYGTSAMEKESKACRNICREVASLLRLDGVTKSYVLGAPRLGEVKKLVKWFFDAYRSSITRLDEEWEFYHERRLEATEADEALMVNRIQCHLDISFGIQAEMIYLLYSRIYAIIFGKELKGEESGLWFAAEFLAKRKVGR